MILSVFDVDWKKYSIKMKALLDASDNGTMSPLFWAELLEIPMIEDNEITPTCLFSFEDSASFVDKLGFPVRLVCNQSTLMYIFEMSNGERLGFQSLGQAKQRQHNYLFPYLLPFACHKTRGEIMAKKLTELECLEFMLKNYAKNIRKQGYCEQCQHPDYDGLCECGHGNEEIGNLFINIRLYIDNRRK